MRLRDLHESEMDEVALLRLLFEELGASKMVANMDTYSHEELNEAIEQAIALARSNDTSNAIAGFHKLSDAANFVRSANNDMARAKEYFEGGATELTHPIAKLLSNVYAMKKEMDTAAGRIDTVLLFARRLEIYKEAVIDNDMSFLKDDYRKSIITATLKKLGIL
jgi:hypothetical protein